MLFVVSSVQLCLLLSPVSDNLFVVSSVQLASDSSMEHNLEQMMDEYHGLLDDDTPRLIPYLLELSEEAELNRNGSQVARLQISKEGNGNGFNLKHATKQSETTKRQSKKVKEEKEVTSSKEREWQCKEEAGKVEEEWKARNMKTAFGVTDDMVTLGDGREYYFFKLPHKVCAPSSQKLIPSFCQA